MDHRIYHPAELIPGAEIVVSGEEHHHAARVVRVRPGQAVELFDGRGNAVAAEVIESAREALRLRVTARIDSRESPLDLALAVAIIQLEKFELVLQKATELGVRTFIPLVTERVEIRPERYRGKAERWEKIVFEAVKQSGRAMLPVIEAPAAFSDAIRRDGTKIVLDMEGNDPRALSPLRSAMLFIGPEGGWSDEELGLARQHNCTLLRLGPRRLRAETAAIAAASIIAAHHGDI